MSRLQTPIRRNDNVVVITGKDGGKRGRVLKVLPEKNRVVVEGVNIIKRHTKPNPGKNIKGGMVRARGGAPREQRAAGVPRVRQAHARVGHKVLADGRKVRVCRKCKGVVDK